MVVAVVAFLATRGGDDPEPPRGSGAAAIPEGNLISNPSFEENLDGWDFFQSDAGARAGRRRAGRRLRRARHARRRARASTRSTTTRTCSRRRHVGGHRVRRRRVGEGDAGDRREADLHRDPRLDAGPARGHLHRPGGGVSDGERRASTGRSQVRYVAPLDDNTIDVHVYRYPGEMVAGESFLVDAITVIEGTDTQREHATRRRRHLRRMRPAVAWTGDAIEIIDQTLLPAEVRMLRLTHGRRGRRRDPAPGRARRARARRDRRARRAAGARRRATAERIASARPTAVNLRWAVERVLAADDREAEALAILDGGRRRLPRDRRARPRGAAARVADPHGLQRGPAGDGRASGTALGRRLRQGRGGRAGRGLRLRDAPAAAGRAADRVGAGRRRHPGHRPARRRRARAARRAGESTP